MSTTAHFRKDAEQLSGALPPLLAEAERLATSISMGVHGRRRSGMGESFWQYRHALPGDDMANVDWRRSGRSDAVYIREQEAEAAHTVAIWCDTAQSMEYRGKRAEHTKAQRAKLLSLALSVLLSKGGERVSFPATRAAKPRAGELQLQRITQVLSAEALGDEYGSAPDFGDMRAARSVFFSDFLGAEETVFPPLKSIAERAGTGCLVQILDESEESFPFDGRVIFQSMGGGINFETHRAKSLRAEYVERLAARQDALETFARQTGWRYLKHHTNDSPRAALLWLYMAIGGQG